MSIKPRSVSSLDYVRLFDSGCVKTRLDNLIQAFMHKLEVEEKDKLRLKEYREALKAKKPPKPFHWKELSGGERHRRYLEKARKMAKDILEQERRAFVKFREEKLFKKLTFIRDKFKAYMFSVDEEGKPVKATFVSRNHIKYVENYVTFFGTDKDRDRMKVIGDLNRALSQVRYMIPYVSSETKALWDKIAEIRIPDHYENWYGNQPIQIYGGKYAKKDKGLTPEKWRKRVKERAEKLIAKKAS